MPNTKRSNTTATQLIASSPEDIKDTYAFSSWFADVYRWADLERVEDIKTEAWKGLKQIALIEARIYQQEIILGKLQAYEQIQLIETQADPDLDPDVDEGTDATITNDPTFPTEGADAVDPVLPSRTGLNPT